MSKKTIAAMYVFAISLAFVTTFVHEAQANAIAPDRSLSLRDLSNFLQTPEDITYYLWRNFHFEADQLNFGVADQWQSPSEFLEAGKGDCEDFANFAYEILRLNGVPAYLMNVYGSGYAHTVTVYRENGKYNVIDGTQIRHYEADDIRELASDIHPFWNSGAIIAPPKEKKQARVLKAFERRLAAQRHLAQSA